MKYGHGLTAPGMGVSYVWSTAITVANICHSGGLTTTACLDGKHILQKRKWQSMSVQSLIQQFTELCSLHSIVPTPEQLEVLTKKVERYQACCRCYNWNESLRGLLPFYYQIDAGIRHGVIGEPSKLYIKQKHLSHSPRQA